jgi:hypothetical protein
VVPTNQGAANPANKENPTILYSLLLLMVQMLRNFSICINYFVCCSHLPIICIILHYPCTFLYLRSGLFNGLSHFSCDRLVLPCSFLVPEQYRGEDQFFCPGPFSAQQMYPELLFIYLFFSHYFVYINDVFCCWIYRSPFFQGFITPLPRILPSLSIVNASVA